MRRYSIVFRVKLSNTAVALDLDNVMSLLPNFSFSHSAFSESFRKEQTVLSAVFLFPLNIPPLQSGPESTECEGVMLGH